MSSHSLTGYAYAIAAFVIWGLFPIYWKWLAHANALEVLAHRVFWTVPFVAVVLTVAGHWFAVRGAFRDRRQIALLAVTTVLIAVNWGIYIWAVNNDQVVQASLGYFLTPLLNVVFGMVLFDERLRAWQWAAVALAATGVANQLLLGHSATWISLGVGISFAGYGALRKLVVADTATGLFVETALLAPLALAWMVWLAIDGGAVFLADSLTTDLLFLLCGVVTGTPLLLYVAATKRLALTTVGLLFYLTPTLQFALGVFVYSEPIVFSQLLTFIFIWTALLLYTLEGQVHARRLGTVEVI